MKRSKRGGKRGSPPECHLDPIPPRPPEAFFIVHDVTFMGSRYRSLMFCCHGEVYMMQMDAGEKAGLLARSFQQATGVKAFTALEGQLPKMNELDDDAILNIIDVRTEMLGGVRLTRKRILKHAHSGILLESYTEDGTELKHRQKLDSGRAVVLFKADRLEDPARW